MKFSIYVHDARHVSSGTNAEGLRSGYLAPKVGGGWELAFYPRHGYSFETIAQVKEALTDFGIDDATGVSPGRVTGYAAWSGHPS